MPTSALVADIGGTNARFALADLDTLVIADGRTFGGSDFPSLEDAVAAYLDAVNIRPAAAALAIAAPITGDTISFTNSPWLCDRERLAAVIGADRLLLLNDFEALALSLPLLEPHELHQIGGGAPAEHGTKVVVGAGTGLGVAGLTWHAGAWHGLPGEGGHILLAVEDAEEFAVLQRLQAGRDRVSVERALSGPGLADLYRSLAEIGGVEAAPLEPAEVAARGMARSDALAEKALALFVTWFGRFAGDAALFFGAKGGAYIGGGIVPKILGALTDGRFRGAFEAKGRMTGFVAPIPIFVILAEHAALKGAAAALSNLAAA
jgi:glucokinase